MSANKKAPTLVVHGHHSIIKRKALSLQLRERKLLDAVERRMLQQKIPSNMHIHHHSQRLKISPKVLPPFWHGTTSETMPTFVMAHFSERLTKWLRTRPSKGW